MTPKKPPKHLNSTGRAFWRATLAEYDFEKSHDFQLLEQAAECLDRIEQCRAAVLKDGLFQNDRYGRPCEHDALKVERAQKKLFLSITREMGLSLDRQEPQKRRLY